MNIKHSALTCPCTPSSIVTSPPPKFTPTISGISWSRFWSASIPLTCRTLWYRLIHNRIPHRGLLHYIFPDKFLTDLCPRCSCSADSLSHFFFTCPSIQTVWSHFFTYLSSSPPDTLPTFLITLFHDLRSLSILHSSRPDNTTTFTSLSFSQVTICILQAIRSAHWAFIFHDTPLLGDNIISTATRLLDKLDSELNLYSNL
ncbi:hypothetical protein BD770DRAFT_333796 [Pilaira anomala]|nr:hypothetical protein BD770DRAFT_333796 [Pilaira anomala]